MFNKRSVQVKFVKDAQAPTTPEPPLEVKMAVISHYIEKAVKEVGKVAIAYITVDTARTILINRMTKK